MSKKESNPQPPGARPEPPPAPPGILTDNTAVIRTLEARIAELELENSLLQDGQRLMREANTHLHKENQRLRDAHKSNSHQELKTVEYAERGHRCSYRAAYEAVKQRSQMALLGGGG